MKTKLDEWQRDARWFGRLRGGMSGVMLAIALIGFTTTDATSAQLAGVAFPDTRDVAGTRLVLNGIALRTYSILHVWIYVAGLYLEQRSSNAETVLDSPETKLLEVHFLRDVSRQRAREVWRTGFANNCRAPCYLDPQDVARFIATVPAIHRGDVTVFLFTPRRLVVTLNGHVLGTITDRHFAREVLDTFIGPVPPTPRVKRELLGGR
ncbi:MAG TPA: chalcone isomerase family protein [Acetobacteraceae bacterium]|nr:chalcone isomerase family protein [Acetobacteraceae bacterium]